MKDSPFFKTVGNERGFVLVAAMVVLLILVILGIAATNTTNIEYLVAANDRTAKEDFYNQEACMATAKVQFRTWLTTAYLSSSETTAFFPAAGTDANGNGINDLSECKDPNGLIVGSYKVRDVEATDTPITTWEDIADFGGAANAAKHPANNFPAMAHIDKPPPGSGYDPKNFEIRRYVITSYAPDNARRAILQEGVYKVFNKY